MNKTDVEIEHVSLAALDNKFVPYERSYYDNGTRGQLNCLTSDNRLDLTFTEIQELMRIMHALVGQ